MKFVLLMAVCFTAAACGDPAGKADWQKSAVPNTGRGPEGEK